MSANVSSGLPWVLIDVVGVIVLAIAAVYAIYMWRQRRQTRLSGPASVPGPAPASQGRDQRGA